MDKKSCVTCIDPEKCWSIHHQKECANNNYKNWQPKQEDKMKKTCDTCDYSETMAWNSYNCNETRNEATDTCGDNYSRWKLRRDYKQENKEQENTCHYSKCVSYNKTYTGNCTYRSGNEIPTCMYYKQYKEQEMSYKTTSKCTLKNIMDIAYASNCSEVCKNVVDVLNAHMINNYDLPGRNQEIDSGSPFFVMMTDRSDKCKWLTEKGIIEEEISLKPCPFCGSENAEYVSHAGTTFLRCIKCSSSGAVGSSLKKADEYWNTRK